MTQTSQIRRSIADLRALCHGTVHGDEYNPGICEGAEIELGIGWDDHKRARRLECHGWIREAQHDAGEGYYATLTATGCALYTYWWGAHENGELEELLDPEKGGGVDVFCDMALQSGHLVVSSWRPHSE